MYQILFSHEPCYVIDLICNVLAHTVIVCIRTFALHVNLSCVFSLCSTCGNISMQLIVPQKKKHHFECQFSLVPKIIFKYSFMLFFLMLFKYIAFSSYLFLPHYCSSRKCMCFYSTGIINIFVLLLFCLLNKEKTFIRQWEILKISTMSWQICKTLPVELIVNLPVYISSITFFNFQQRKITVQSLDSLFSFKLCNKNQGKFFSPYNRFDSPYHIWIDETRQFTFL